MKTFLLIAAMAYNLSALAETDITFNFHDTMSLNPAINEPGQKQGVELSGRTFTCDGVEVSFKASDYGNTHVRLYHSYDAGVDLRLYDGDEMTITVTDETKFIKDIRFTMSLSGAESGSNDINFIPSTGDYDWVSEIWRPYEGDKPRIVVLASSEQSRIYTMTVTLDVLTSVAEVEMATSNSAAVYYNLIGKCIASSPLAPGVYVRIQGNDISKVVIR